MSTRIITPPAVFVYERDIGGFSDGALETASWTARRPVVRKRRTPVLADFGTGWEGYDLPAQANPVPTTEQEIAALLAPSKAEKAAAAKTREQIAREKAAVAYEAAASPAGRSAESRTDEQHPLAAPAASELQSALDLASDSADFSDARDVYFAAHDIWCQLGTLCDRWPRRARRTESGAWQRGGVITETLDAICFSFERRYERACSDEARAKNELADAQRALQHGEVDMTMLMAAEDKAVERQEEVEFFFQLFSAGRAAYALLIGAPWQSRQRMKTERAAVLGLANAQLHLVHEFTPMSPAATSRVIVMGSGDGEGLADALKVLRVKHPALTLYTGNRAQGVEAVVARFALAESVQLIQFALDPKHGRSAPFRRNALMLGAAKPTGVILHGPRTHGPTDNLGDLARAGSIPVWDLRPALAAAQQEAPPVVA